MTQPDPRGGMRYAHLPAAQPDLMISGPDLNRLFEERTLRVGGDRSNEALDPPYT